MFEKIKMPIPLNFDFTKKKHGFFALLVGAVITLILGALSTLLNWGSAGVWWVLALGTLVGILNIFHKEGVLLVLTLLTLVFMFTLLGTGLALFPAWAVNLFNAVIYFIAPVAIIVSLKVLYALAVK